MTSNWVIIRSNGQTITGQGDDHTRAGRLMQQCAHERYCRVDARCRFFIGNDRDGLSEYTRAEVLDDNTWRSKVCVS